MYYFGTTICAVILGIVLVVSIQPGSGNTSELSNEENKRYVTTADTLMDLIRNAFPPNLVEACIKQTSTVLIHPGNDTIPKEEWVFKSTMGGSMNILGTYQTTIHLYIEFSVTILISGLIAFSLAFGIAISMSEEDGKPVLTFLESFVTIIMKITNWIIHLAPIGVCFLVAGEVIKMKDVAENFGKLGWFFATVVVGLVIHGCLLLPLLFGIITRTLPFKFISNMSRALATAFGTSSSSATLPVTIDCLEKENNVDPRVSRFVLPIGKVFLIQNNISV